MLQSQLQSETIARQLQELEKTIPGPPHNSYKLPKTSEMESQTPVLSPCIENLQQMAAAGGRSQS
jgi:hypothetical protein